MHCQPRAGVAGHSEWPSSSFRHCIRAMDSSTVAVGHLAMRDVEPGYSEAVLLEDDGHVILDTIDACIFIA